LQGAAAILQQVKPPTTPVAEAEPVDEAFPGTEAAPKGHATLQLRQSIRDYSKSAAALTPEVAALQWLALADRFAALGQSSSALSMEMPPPSFTEIVAVLPGPQSWPALRSAVEARKPLQTRSVRDLSLLLLADVLTSNTRGQWTTLAALQAQLATQGGAGPYKHPSEYSHRLYNAMAQVSGDPQRLAQVVQEPMGGRSTFVRNTSGAVRKPPVLQMPDLVTLAGPAKAQEQIRRTLLTTTAEIDIPLGDETRALAQRIALSEVRRIKIPQWSLAQSISATKLFSAMEQRFMTPPTSAKVRDTKARSFVPASQWNTPSYRLARMYYLLGLIADKRVDDALALATRMGRTGGVSTIPPEALESLDRAGHTLALNYFLRDMLTKNPDLPYWNIYIVTAARVGQTDWMLALVRKAAARKGVKPAQVFALRQNLYRALLAADRVPEGVTVLRQLMASPVPAGIQVERYELATTLVRLGYLMKQPAWANEGVRAVRSTLSRPDTESYSSIDPIALLLSVGRDAEAEKELAVVLKRAAAQSAADSTPYMDYENGSVVRELTALAGIYHRRARHKDVLNLLDNAPWWGVQDLAKIYRVTDSSGTPLGYMAASALAAVGRKDEALRINQAVLEADRGFDPAYQLLTNLQGVKSLPVLDALFAADQFEERPLIWKAAVLLKAGRPAEAEQSARKAISIDPSDGEQGKGRRMRVYGVLADILAARGDRAESEKMRGAVKAIRVAENADDFYEAGLLSRGIRMYKQALTYFGNAYCIQSRLAIQLAAQGRMKEAEVHYQRAYELMPDSFGRMESHCFGCEGAFEGQRAGQIAEKVFTRLLTRNPNKPQLHYLIGYLREDQGRYREALAQYRRAVQLDRDYINAWNKLLGLGENMQLPARDRENAVLNLLRLDPALRHVTPDFTLVSNLRLLWRAGETAVARRGSTVPETLYALRASAPIAAKQAEQMKKMLGDSGMSEEAYAELMGGSWEDDESMRPSTLTPAEMIAQQSVVASLIQIMDLQLHRNRMRAQNSV
jgi:tetratricopeptide (TPR) repeat protein